MRRRSKLRIPLWTTFHHIRVQESFRVNRNIRTRFSKVPKVRESYEATKRRWSVQARSPGRRAMLRGCVRGGY